MYRNYYAFDAWFEGVVNDDRLVEPLDWLAL